MTVSNAVVTGFSPNHTRGAAAKASWAARDPVIIWPAPRAIALPPGARNCSTRPSAPGAAACSSAIRYSPGVSEAMRSCPNAI